MKERSLVLLLVLLIVLVFSPVLQTLRAEEKEVVIKGFTFKPKKVVVSVGSTVVWIQQDRASHTVTANEGGFDSGSLSKGDRFTQTFSEKGSFAYICKYHPSMRGKVIVK